MEDDFLLKRSSLPFSTRSKYYYELYVYELINYKDYALIIFIDRSGSARHGALRSRCLNGSATTALWVSKLFQRHWTKLRKAKMLVYTPSTGTKNGCRSPTGPAGVWNPDILHFLRDYLRHFSLCSLLKYKRYGFCHFCCKTIQFNAFPECFNFREHEIRNVNGKQRRTYVNCHKHRSWGKNKENGQFVSILLNYRR